MRVSNCKPRRDKTVLLSVDRWTTLSKNKNTKLNWKKTNLIYKGCQLGHHSLKSFRLVHLSKWAAIQQKNINGILLPKLF